MTADEIRLELIKLVHRHDHEPAAIVRRAGELEQFVTGSSRQASTLGLPKTGTAPRPSDRKN